MLALQALCTLDAVGDSFRAEIGRFLSDDENLADLDLESPADPDVIQFAKKLADGAWGARNALDERLQRTASHWRVARMTPVDRNVLRLGLWELLNGEDVPGPVAVDEAVDLARRFGDTDSPAFVNGVLDALRREISSPAG